MRGFGISVCKAIAPILISAAVDVGAMPTLLFNSNTTLYRFDGTTLESFEISDRLGGMTTGPDGTVWATGVADVDDDGKVALYTLSDPFGAPSLELQGDFLPKTPVSLGFIDETMYVLGLGRKMYTVDPVAQTWTLVGQSGETGHRFVGSGYDPINNILYGTSPASSTTRLQSIDYQLVNGVNPSATLIANITPSDVFSGGAEYHDGVLYSLLGQDGASTIRVGTLDTQTGVHSLLTELITVELPVDSLALTVITPQIYSADFDNDGDVDGVDLAVMFANFNGPGGGVPLTPATDMDGDGDADGVDLAAAFAQFTGPLSPTNVPEPGSGLVWGAACLLSARRRG